VKPLADHGLHALEEGPVLDDGLDLRRGTARATAADSSFTIVLNRFRPSSCPRTWSIAIR
jgi:hypothetical protein